MIPLHLHRIQDINTWSSKLDPHDVGSYTTPCSTSYHQSVQRTTPASRHIPALVLQLNYHWWALGTQSLSKFKVPSFPSSFHILCCAALRRVKALFLRCSGTQLTQMLAQVPWGTGYVPTDLDMVLWNICPMHVGTPSFSHNHPSPRFILFLEALDMNDKFYFQRTQSPRLCKCLKKCSSAPALLFFTLTLRTHIHYDSKYTFSL